MKVIEGGFPAPNAKIAIVIARFNSFINESLLSGAIDTLKRHGQVSEDNITVVRCPGAVELPLVAQRVAKTGKFDAIVSLGTVIRGGTPHFDYVCSECNKGLAQVSLEYSLPVAFGVLTVDTIDQAIERAGTKAGNKGAEAALSALEMINVLSGNRFLMGASVKPAARRNARQFALQAIYSWQITKENIATVEEQFLSGGKYDEEEHHAAEPALAMPETDVAYFRDLLTGVALSHMELDSKLRPFVSRPMQDLDLMELALLRLAMYEMTRREDVPYKVVINEAIELAKVFAAEDSHKFVNGVLDKAAPHVRKK